MDLAEILRDIDFSIGCDVDPNSLSERVFVKEILSMGGTMIPALNNFSSDVGLVSEIVRLFYPVRVRCSRDGIVRGC